MPTRDLANDIEVSGIVTFDRVQGSDGTIIDSSVIDLNGYQSVTLVGMTGRCVDGTRDVSLRFILTHSDATNNASFENVPSKYIIGQDSHEVDLVANGNNANAISNQVVKFGYKGTKRYVRLSFQKLASTGNNQSNRVNYCMFSIGGHLAQLPVGFELDDENEDHRT